LKATLKKGGKPGDKPADFVPKKKKGKKRAAPLLAHLKRGRPS